MFSFEFQKKCIIQDNHKAHRFFLLNPLIGFLFFGSNLIGLINQFYNGLPLSLIMRGTYIKSNIKIFFFFVFENTKKCRCNDKSELKKLCTLIFQNKMLGTQSRYKKPLYILNSLYTNYQKERSVKLVFAQNITHTAF